MFHFLIIMLIIITILLVGAIATSISVNYKGYKYYSLMYNKLSYLTFYKVEDVVYSNSSDEITFFADGDIQLAEGVYLWKRLPIGFDPYMFFWLLKYWYFFHKHIKPQLS